MRVFLLSMLFLLGIAGTSSGQVINCSGWITRDTSWTQLAVGDDNSSSQITLPFNFCWYGTNLTSVYVNNNGNISFGTPYGDYSAAGFPNGSFVMLAPFWADVDTRGAGSGGVYYKVFSNYMVVQWDGVGYYGAHADKLDYFQIVISDGNSSLTPNGNVAYSYKDMQWTTGDASAGSGGFGGYPAVVGANKGDGVNYFQLGAFNTTGNTYNGSSTASGVDWLDNQQFVFDACTPNSGNLPPIMSGISRCDTLRLCVGDTLPINLNGFGPEAAQTVTFSVTYPGVTGYTIVSNTPGTLAQLQSYLVGTTGNVGLNTIHIAATDNDSTPASTTMDIKVLVQPLPAISAQPVSRVKCEGDSTAFSVTATGIGISYQWQADTGSGYVNLSDNSVYAGTTTHQLTLAATDTSLNGDHYRCVVKNSSGCFVNSNDAVLTVNKLPRITHNPADTTICQNGVAAFAAAATGTGITYQWQVNAGSGFSNVTGAPYAGVTTDTLKIVSIPVSMQGYKYRCIISGICATDTTNIANLRIDTLPVINTQAIPVTVCNGENVSFSIVAAGTNITYQWQVNTGSGFTALSNGGQYTGTATNMLSIAGANTAMNGNQYRCLVSGKCGPVATGDSVLLTVNPRPVTAFSANSSSQCLSGNSFAFTNATTIAGSTVISYQWNFGDGTTSTAVNDVHTYAAAGTYTVKLVATSISGCKDSVQHTVTVYPQPAVAFTTASASQCFSGNSFTFNNTSSVSSGTIAYAWTFGDGAASNATSPVHSYATAGAYTVKLVSTTGFGCKDSAAATMTVFPKPTPSFTINTAAGQCLYNNSYSFTNTSSLSAGSMSYTWAFGDGATDTAANPVHVYTTAGTYTVKLIVSSNSGCADSVSQTITVYPQPAVAFNTANTAQCINGNSFAFANTSSLSSGVMTYAWTFGDGWTDTVANPVHIYTAAGTYTVKLIATTGSGCKDSATATVTVYPKPAPAFTINAATQCFNTNNYSFTNTSAISAGTLTYLWNFGDGNSDTAASPAHTYAAAGTYSVTLIATSNNGCTDSVTQTVTIFPAPAAAFAVNNSGQCVNTNSFSFGNGSALSSGTMTYAWTFGDGNSDTAANPVHAYTTPGNYTVKLVVTTDHGCTDSVSQTITVYPKPSPAFTVNNSSQCETGNNFIFTNTGTISSGSMTHSWDFGDGNTSIQASPSNTYATAGTYVVLLTSSSNNGCTDTVSQLVVVKPMPAAPVTVPVTYCQYATTAALTASGTANLWYTAAAGGPGSAAAPVPSSSTPGNTTWYVTQTVNGCESIRTAISDTIYAAPVSTAVASGPVAFCNGDSVRLDANLGAGLSYQWTYNGTPVSGASDSSYAVRITGSYAVTVTGDHHCSLSSSPAINVTVHPLPDAYITYSTPISFCQDGAVVLTGDVAQGYAYQWYKDGAPMNGEVNYYYIASQQGIYSLKVTNQFGCVQMSSTSVPVTVFPKPAPVIYKNGFDLSTGQYVTYQWFFNGQVITNAVQQSYNATQDGAYYVEVTDGNGCTQRSSSVFVDNVSVASISMSSKDIRVYPNPTQGIVNIDAPAKVNYFITSVEGKLLQSGQDVYRIDISRFPDGMYMLNITDEENHLLKTEKLFKSGN
ncbi:PKD domain-containing protein [Chitinophagaceae bacterium MMS25-I14]